MADVEVDPTASLDYHPASTILNGLRVYGVILVAGWVGFEVARKKITANAYYCRDRSAETTCQSVELARNAPFFKWLLPLYTTSDDEVFQRCGLDTLFFLRFLRLGQKVALASVILTSGLFPVYYYGDGDGDGDAVYKMTLSHITDTEIWRFWFTVGSMYIMSGWCCFLLWREYKAYVKRRHEFMSRRGVQQYSIVVNGLPKHLCTQQTLRNYLQLMFPRSVLHVYVALECGDLEALVDERAKVRDRLENALAKSAKTGERVLTSKSMCGGQKVDAIELYQDQLKSLNNAVEMEVRVILRNQAALASQMIESSVDEDYTQTPTLGERSIPTLQEAHEDELKDVESAYVKGLRRERRGIKSTGIMRPAGFVTFNSLKAAQAAQQVLQSADPTEMHIEPAPDAEDIVWGNIGISYNQKTYWLLISIAITGAIILFWTIPTTFVVSLSKVDTLKNKWAWLARVINDYPWLGSVLEQLSPLMVSVMAALAPIIFGILSKREGHSSGSQVESSLLNKLVAYQVFLVFLLPIIGGTIIDSITGKGGFSSASEVLTTLSEAIPAQSSFFITYVLVQMGLNLTLELLRVNVIIKAIIYEVFAPKLTPRQRSSPWFGLCPLSVPGDFGQTDLVASYYLVLILILVFGAVAPMMSYFAGVYLLLSELVYRWLVLCVYDPSPNSVGVFFPSLYRFCIGALIFSQAIMASLLATKQVALPATFSIILPFLTVGFHLFIASRYPRTAENLPLDQCVLVDARRSRQLEDLEKSLEDVYRQPAMAERAPIVPDDLGSDPNDGMRLSSPPPEVC